MPILKPSSDVNLSPTSNLSSLTTTNLLQPTSFKMVINRKMFPNLEFFCQSFTHPDVSVPAAEMAYRRIASIPFAGDKFTFGELSCMVILDEEMNSYREMLNWLERTIEVNQVTPVNANKTPNYNESPPTYSDITLSILSSKNNVVREIRYIDCMPTGLGSINFEAMAGGDQFITYPVTFRYTYFEIR